MGPQWVKWYYRLRMVQDSEMWIHVSFAFCIHFLLCLKFQVGRDIIIPRGSFRVNVNTEHWNKLQHSLPVESPMPTYSLVIQCVCCWWISIRNNQPITTFIFCLILACAFSAPCCGCVVLYLFFCSHRKMETRFLCMNTFPICILLLRADFNWQ